MRLAAIVLSILLVICTLSACSTPATQAKNDSGLDISMQAQPPNGMQQELDFTLTDKDKKPVDGATVEIEGNMNHPGMAPVNAKAEGKGSGKYVALINYTMGGDWSITVNAHTGDGSSLVKTFSMNVKQ